MPRLVRLYIRSVAIGFGLAVVFVALLVGCDIAGVGRLILASDKGWIAAGMLVLFNGTLFAATQFGIAVMGLAASDGTGSGPGAGLRPVRVAVRQGGGNRSSRGGVSFPRA